MTRRIEYILLFLLTASSTIAKINDYEKAICIMCGVSEIESLDENTIERFEHLLLFPFNINSSSRSRLSSCGLFTPYQVATILDYRSRHGDILSSYELALIDGFNSTQAEAVRPFVSFASNLVPGSIEGKNKLRGTINGRYLSKVDKSNYGLKFNAEYGEIIAAGFSTRNHYDTPAIYSYSAAVYNKKGSGKVIIGDYNAKFGQGLLLWNGMTMNTITDLSYFGKRPTGLSPSFSYGTTCRKGIAADYNIKNLVATVFFDYKENLYAGNLTLLQRRGQYGLSSIVKNHKIGASADVRFCLRCIDIFGEAGFEQGNRGHNISLGLSSKIWNDHEAAFKAERTDKLTAVTYGIGKGSWVISNELSLRDKSNARSRLSILGGMDFTESLTAKLRLNQMAQSYGQKHKTDLRVDLCYDKNKLKVNYRINLLKCKKFAALSYVEGGYKSEKFSIWARFTGFIVDNWDDRIYSYERDAPGIFNVPAYYGRGISSSVYASCKFRRLKAYLRAGYIAFPWSLTPKDPRPELHISLTYGF